MPQTIAITFAGRRDRMSLLCASMRQAMDRKIVDAWHVWNFARNPEDAAWVASLDQTHPGITVKTPPGEGYKHVYTAYAREDYADDDVFLKIDDDIVYIDLNGLEHMISFRRLNPQYYIVSANVVNNSLCFLMQREMGCWPDLPSLKLMTSGPEATALHRAFLAGSRAFYGDVAEYKTELVLNINCVSWLGADLESVCMCDSTSVGSDETNLSSHFPTIFKRPACIFGPCVVSHLSFHTQDADMPVAELIDAYASFMPAFQMDPLQGSV